MQLQRLPIECWMGVLFHACVGSFRDLEDGDGEIERVIDAKHVSCVDIHVMDHVLTTA